MNLKPHTSHLKPSSKGQSIVEVLIAIAVGTIFIVGAAALIVPALKSNTAVNHVETGAALGKELFDNVRVFSEADWHNISALSTSSAHRYYLNTSQSPFVAVSGTEAIVLSTTTITRYFYLDDAYRDANNNIASSSVGNTYDPSTKKITVVYTQPNTATGTLIGYLTRNRANLYDQTDWSGGATSSYASTSIGNLFSSSTGIAYASTTGSISNSVATTSAGSFLWVQSVVHSGVGTLARSIAFPSGNTAGNTIVVTAYWTGYKKNPIPTASVSDSEHNTYTAILLSTTTSQSAEEIWYASNVKGGSNTVSVSLSLNSVSNFTAAIFEYSGIATSGAIDATSTANATSGTSLDSGALTTSVASDSIFAFGIASSSLSAGGGFTQRVSTGTTMDEDITESSAGTYHATMSQTASGLWMLSAVAFSPAAGNTIRYVQSVGLANQQLQVKTPFTSANAAGDMILVSAGWVPSSTSVTISDSASNTYAIATGPLYSIDGSTTVEMWYAKNIAQAAANTVFLNFSTGYNLVGNIISLEYTDLDTIAPLDVSNTWQSSSGLSMDSGFATTTHLNELVFGFGIGDNESSTLTPGTGFKSRGGISQATGSLSGALAEDNNVGPIGSYDAPMTQSTSTPWLDTMVTFKINSNISSTARWAWNDDIGWLDFYNTNSVVVGPYGLTGYASSSAGDISLDCDTTEIGNICNTSNYQVSNDGEGDLGGWAWSDQYGWISFYWGNSSANPTGASSALCTSYGGYCGVSIDSSGDFHGYAWNDTVGWIDFNCNNATQSSAGGICGTSNFKVTTSWTPSSTVITSVGTLDSLPFDTGVASGSQLNSVLFTGSEPAGTSVNFQFAVSNSSSGPWNFMGPDGTSQTYYTPTGPSSSLPLDYSLLNNFRYFEYQIVLDATQANAPRVDDVIINWSP